MTYIVTLDQFAGPLDLLVQMIEEEKLDISRISLAKIADQFVNYLNQVKDVKLSELADFIYFAAKLLYLKSIILLPTRSQVEEEEILKFEEQIKIYKEFREATHLIKNLLQQKRYSFSREKFYLTGEYFIPPKNVDLNKIFIVFQRIIKNLEKNLLIAQKIKKRIISLADKIREINELLLEKKKINFSEIAKKAKSKLELIIHFLAVLELVKRKVIEVKQKEIFGEIEIIRL
ncbi:MAG: segregation and condensation protein A [Patescibacteria group bacterium]